MLHEKDILNFIAELKGKSEAGNFEETVEEMTAGHLLPADCSSLRPVKTGAHAKGFPRNSSASDFRHPAFPRNSPGSDFLRIFKLSDNIFLIIHKNTSPLKIDVKCDPKLAKLLKTRYETIQPSKQLGNQGIELILTGQLPATEIKDLITHSLYRAQAQNN